MTVVLKRDGVVVPFAAGDSVYFTVKASLSSPTALIQKVATTFEQDGSPEIKLVPIDTKNLPTKRYFFDVQYTTEAGAVTTIIRPSAFVVGAEVTNE